MPADKAARLRTTMEKYFPEAEVTGYESLVAGLQNDGPVVSPLRSRQCPRDTSNERELSRRTVAAKRG
jgi:hypothetical protein